MADHDPANGVAGTDGPVTLGPTAGETLRIQFDFRFTTPSVNDPSAPNAASMRFGLYGDPDGPISVDNSQPASDNAVGYFVRLAAAQTTISPGAAIIRETGTFQQICGTEAGGAEDDTTRLAENLSYPGLNDTSPHHFMLELVRLSSGGVRLTFFMDDMGNPVLSAVDTTPFTNFNMFTFRSSNDFAPLAPYVLDNVSLSTPEPGSAFIAALAGVGLLGRRRNRAFAPAKS